MRGLFTDKVADDYPALARKGVGVVFISDFRSRGTPSDPDAEDGGV